MNLAVPDRRRVDHAPGRPYHRSGPIWAGGSGIMAATLEVASITIGEGRAGQVLILREVAGGRTLPIVIGLFEAASIDHQIKGPPSPRPLTHDLIVATIRSLGGELRDVSIGGPEDHTYFARLSISQEGRPVEVDARPSDAIALAVAEGVPILAAENVPGQVDGPPGRPYHRSSPIEAGGEATRGRRGRRGDPPGVGAKGASAVAVQMELTRIIISENNDQQIIFLKEVDGERTFPIVIGIFEATSIDRRVKGLPAPRPLTHDLLASTIELLGGELQDIFISELKDHTYFARLRIRHEGELIEVDSRPSDAIAVAVTVDVPIYVSEEVLNEVGQ